MKRGLLRVIAWIGATALSIAVANAAVGSVRNRVSDLPDVSLAALTETASIVAAPSTPSVPTSTSVTPTSVIPTTLDSSPIGPAPSTAPTTAVGATSATSTAPPTSAGAVPTTSTTPTSTAAAASEIKTYSVSGGTVSIEVFDDRIVLLGAVPAPGWSVDEVEQSSTHIEIEFKSGELESHFNAELGSDGHLSVEIE